MSKHSFSKREQDVIEHLLLGKSNKKIAWELSISVATVEFHLKNIYTKLQVNSRAEAIVRISNERSRKPS